MGLLWALACSTAFSKSDAASRKGTGTELGDDPERRLGISSFVGSVGRTRKGDHSHRLVVEHHGRRELGLETRQSSAPGILP